MKLLKLLLLGSLVFASCEKEDLPMERAPAPKYYVFDTIGGEYMISYTDEEILLYTFAIGDCWRPVRDGDLIPAVPEDPNISISEDYIEIIDLHIIANRVDKPWNLTFCG